MKKYTRMNEQEQQVEYMDIPLELFQQRNVIEEEIEKTQIENRELYLNGEIDEESVTELIQKIRYYNTLSSEPITLYINSGGGSAYDGFALIDCIKRSESPIAAVAEGAIMSMAVAVFAACDIRISGKYTQFMVHNLSAVFGHMTYKDIKVQQKHLQCVTNQYCEILADSSNLTKEQWYTKLYEKDSYFTADEALEFGLVQEIC